MKAVLVIDMPDCCKKCPCYVGTIDNTLCNVLNTNMLFASYGRLGDCPLKPLPLKGTMENVMVDGLKLVKRKWFESESNR